MPRLLIIDDEDTLRESLRLSFEGHGYAVTEAADRPQAEERLAAGSYDAALLDVRLGDADGIEVLEHIKREAPLTEVIMITAFAEIDAAVQAMKGGAYDFVTKPFRARNIMRLVDRAVERKELTSRVARLEHDLRDRYSFDEIIGRCTRMVEMMKTVSQVARADSSVLILGESGTGKELVARAIHFNSPRADNAFVPVNCAAIPETLQESELFGHIQGAFTDARRDRVGLLEEADNGSVLLDEVGELTPATQAKLLRFLQDGEVRRVGATRTRHVDTRVIAATNRDLDAAKLDGSFREDLYYRLAVIEIEVPPLRERADDIELLTEYFLRSRGDQADGDTHRKRLRRFSRRALAALQQHTWPGNVRELENVVERALLLAERDTIDLQDLPETLRPEHSEPSHAASGGALRLDDVERSHIEQVLRQHDGHRHRTASALGIAPSTLWRKLKRYGMD